MFASSITIIIFFQTYKGKRTIRNFLLFFYENNGYNDFQLICTELLTTEKEEDIIGSNTVKLKSVPFFLTRRNFTKCEKGKRISKAKEKGER